jgi:hypothetical protein
VVNHFTVGDLFEMCRRAIEGCGERMQEHWRRIVCVLPTAAIRVREVAPRELLDENLVSGHLRIEGCDPGAQHILHVDVNLGLDAFWPEVMAGEVFALPLPMHHLQALGVLETVFGLDAVRWKLLEEMQVQRTAVPIRRRNQYRRVALILFLKQGLDGLRAVLIVQQHHQFSRTLDALLFIGHELGHDVKQGLACRNRQHPLCSLNQRRNFRQRGVGGALDQSQDERRSLYLARQGDEMLHAREDFGAIVRLPVARFL